MEGKLTYTISETARLLAISRTSAYLLAGQGVIPAVRLGRRLLVPKAALERMLESAGKNEDQGLRDE